MVFRWPNVIKTVRLRVGSILRLRMGLKRQNGVFERALFGECVIHTLGRQLRNFRSSKSKQNHCPKITLRLRSSKPQDHPNICPSSMMFNSQNAVLVSSFATESTELNL